jgi:hypothetical protein
MELEAKGWFLGEAEEWHTYIRKLKYLVSKPKTKLIADMMQIYGMPSKAVE